MKAPLLWARPDTVWEQAALSSLYTVRYGKTNPNRLGKVPVVGSSGIYAWTDTPLVKHPTVVVGRKGSAGRVWLLEVPSYPSDTTFYLEPRDLASVDVTFTYFTLKHFQISASDDVIPSLQRHELENLELPNPPLLVQRAIAGILSKIQEAVELHDKIVATLKELKAATMAKLFREGPQGPGAELRETRFGDVPANWITVPLAEVAHIQTGIAKGRRFGNKSAMVELPYLRVANVQDGFLDLSEIKTIRLRETERQRYSLQSGDVLLTEGGDFDKLGRGHLWNGQIPNCVHQNHIFAVRTNGSTLLPDFFAYLAQSPYGKAYFLSVAHKTTNLACINSTKLKAFPVPLPALSDQRKIATALKKIDESIDLQATRLRIFKSAFSSMLHLLMTGQVRVNSVKPGGERHD